MKANLTLFFMSALLFFQASIAQENPPTITCQPTETLINGACRCLPPSIKQGNDCLLAECPQSTYLDWNTYACEPCHPSCESCWGKNENQCVACQGSLYNPVTGTCESTCSSGFTDSVPNGIGYCYYSNCNQEAMFIDPTAGECTNQCDEGWDRVGSTDAQYYICAMDQCDQSCGALRDYKHCLKSKTFGTCLGACADGYSQLRVSLFNGQDAFGCVTENSRPINTIFFSEQNQYYYCQPQCKTCSEAPDNCLECSNENWFLLANGSCRAECPFGMTPDYDNPSINGQINCIDCDDACMARLAQQRQEQEEAEFTTDIAEYHNVGGTLVSASLAGLQIMRPGSPSIASTILLVNLLQYIRYLSINYPSKLRTAFQKQSEATASLNFGPIFPQSLNEDVMSYHPPERFYKFNINGLFLANFWRGVTTSAILALGVVFVLLLKRLVLKHEKLVMVREKLQSFLTWNYMITFTLSNLDRVTMFAIVEYQDLRLDSPFSIASFVMSIFFLIATLFALLYIPYRLYQIRKEGDIKIEEKLKKHDEVKVMFEKTKHKYYFQEILLFMVGVRAILHNLVIAAFDSPTVQTSLLMVISLSMLTYLLSLRPHIGIVENIELIIYEIIILIVNTTCLYFSTLDSSGQFDAHTASNTIIVCNITALSFSILFSVLKVILQVLKALKDYLAAKKNKGVPQPKPEPAKIYYEKTPVLEIPSQKKAEDFDVNQSEEEDTVPSLDVESEPAFDSLKSRMSHMRAISSPQIVDTNICPSLGILEEKPEAHKLQLYFGEQPITLGSMADTKIDSRNKLF